MQCKAFFFSYLHKCITPYRENASVGYFWPCLIWILDLLLQAFSSVIVHLFVLLYFQLQLHCCSSIPFLFFLVPLSRTQRLHLSLRLPLSILFSTVFSFSRSLSLSLSVSLCLSLSLSVSQTFCLFLSLPLFVSLSVLLFVLPWVSVSLCV